MRGKAVFIRFFVLFILIGTFVACASTPKRESAVVEYAGDSVITAKVKSLLAEDDFFKLFQIRVETYKGAVQLSGFVDSQQTVDIADQIARSVNGVRSVENNLIVKF